MTNAEKVELVLILAATLACWWLADWLPVTTTWGRVFLSAAGLLLLQGLLRDLWLISQSRSAPPAGTVTAMRCLCLESLVGVAGVLFGIALLASGLDAALQLSRGYWCLIVVSVLLTGYLIKDYVVQWKPFKLHKDQNHINIIVTWKN